MKGKAKSSIRTHAIQNDEQQLLIVNEGGQLKFGQRANKQIYGVTSIVALEVMNIGASTIRKGGQTQHPRSNEVDRKYSGSLSATGSPKAQPMDSAKRNRSGCCGGS